MNNTGTDWTIHLIKSRNPDGKAPEKIPEDLGGFGGFAQARPWFQVVAIAGGDRALQRPEPVRVHWANTAGPKARPEDPSLYRVSRRIKRGGLTGDTALLDAYGGVTAARKRAVERQPAAEGRSFQVVTGGERTGHSQRLREARFGSA